VPAVSERYGDADATIVPGANRPAHTIAVLYTDARADVRAHDCAGSTTTPAADAAAGASILRARALPEFGRIQPHRGLRRHPRYR
jgi:hypothetical protein